MMQLRFNSKKTKVRGASSKQSKPSRTFNGRQFLPVLWLSVVIALSVVVVQVVAGKLDQPVSRVVINGDFVNVERQQLVAAVEVFLGSGFLLLDLDGIRLQLNQQPWVFDVMVERHWPDEIAITVIEQKAIAHWGDHAYLNHRGEVFSPDKRAANGSGLPELLGPKDSEQQVMNHFRS
ncbi:cell division protein FtsQ/DivIB [Oceanicoccus sp. KOV_DT_Chl]|uniref:cell division protein FtsQ/DivIB n=1 Tax=Oceanicoccus sp. KOV_DT_Chl TaxID=1904639 RepID=UPI000C7E67C4|nr:FtsQ-type POTRA domain-containing protein [Oceanicoccus sp. KOV_DT_Chl]